MALYWHFRTKDLLMDALVDRVIAEVELGVDRSAPWIDQFRTLIEAMVRRLRAHPWVVSIFSPRTCESPRYLDALEVLLDVLRRGGFSPREAAEVSLHAIRVSISLVGGQPGLGQSHDPEGLQDLQRRSRLVFETLPRDRYPRVIEAAQPLASCEDTDSYYGFGVDLLIRGVAATARISDLS
jgi:AcrR family transcriptional regulator